MRSTMAESDQVSRKRMRFTSPSELEAASQKRSKSEICNHNLTVRHRSAASRVGISFLADTRLCQSLLSEKLETKLPHAYPRVTIKDLRLRRVFSLSSVSNEWNFGRNGEVQNKEQHKESLCGYRNSNVFIDGSKVNVNGLEELRGDTEEDCTQKTPPDAETFRSQPVVAEDGAHRIVREINGSQGNGFFVSAENKSDNYLRSKPVLNQQCFRAKLFENVGSFSYRRLLPYLMEVADAVSVSLCPKSEKPSDEVHPSLNLHGKEENGKTVEDRKEELGEFMAIKDQYAQTKHALRSADSFFNKSSASTSPLSKRMESSPKSVQEHSSRRKLFRTPGSVNYRRLLPYFTDIQEDDPRMSRIAIHSEPRKSTEDNTFVTSSVPDDEGAPETVTLTAIEAKDSNNYPVPEPSEQVSESLEPSDTLKEQETQVKHVILDSENNLETPHKVPGLETPLASLPDSRCSSDVATSSPKNSTVDTLVEQINSKVETRTSEEKAEVENNAEEQEANGLNTKALLLESSASLGTPALCSPIKDILKRSARGCRGLCTCLNCSSFRLHAERAFEFSRNQMQDIEEIVLDLVGEISYLRDMLVKYAPANYTVLCNNQVKDACTRASKAAELAKSRLHQMKDDLQVHCRIPTEQRARVKFAHYIQEKTFLRDREPDT